MGVSTCNRKGCDEIMPQTYLQGIGYICYDCKTEFIKYFQNRFGDEDQPESIIKNELEKFMEMKKSSYSDDTISAYDFFEKHNTH
jgi:hypothetical protein